MPEEEKKVEDKNMVPLDTTGPGAEIDLPDDTVKAEEAPKETTEQKEEPIKVEEVKEEPKETETKKDDSKLEEYG